MIVVYQAAITTGAELNTRKGMLSSKLVIHK